LNALRGILFIILAATAVLPAASASAQETNSFYAMLGYGAYYAPDCWMPVRFAIRNHGTQPQAGYCELPLGDPTGSLRIQVPVQVPALASESVTGYAFFPQPPVVHTRSKQATPLTIAQWISDGKREGRAEILGHAGGVSVAGSPGKSAAADSSLSRLVLVANGPFSTTDSTPSTADHSEGRLHPLTPEKSQLLEDSTNPESVLDLVNASSSQHFVPTPALLETMPRSSVGYDCVAMVVAQDLPFDALDPAQRRALIDYIRGGGVLLVPDPNAGANPSDSWLSPYLPVRLMGHRIGSILNAAAPALTTAVALDEAAVDDTQPTQTHVCLQDSNYVFAAYRTVGLGRIVFTSFPVGALDPKDQRTASVWHDLLGDLQRPHDWANVPLGKQDGAMLQQLIGHAAAPWSAAAAVAGAYAAVVILMQLLLGGPRRPFAFVGSVGVAVLACGGLLATNSFRHRNQTLAGARLTTMDIASSGGGWQQESLACLGPDNLDVAISAATQSWIKPADNGGSPVTLDTPAFRIPSIGISSGRIDHVWHAAGPIATGFDITSHGRFDKDGFHLLAQNDLGSTLHAPLLLYGPTRFSLPDLAAGESTTVPGPQNLTPGDYSYSASVETETSRFRAQMLASAMQQSFGFAARPTAGPIPLIAGWLQTGSKPQLITLDPAPALREETLVRSEVSIDSSSIGEMVHIDSGFNEIAAGPSAIPYNFRSGKWEAVSQAQNWLIAFAPPPNIGTVRMMHATLLADIVAPGHNISIRRGQCHAGHVHDNAAGPLVAEWDRLTGSRSIEIDCADSDLDANGWLWLRLSVQFPPGTLPAPGTLWRFNSLRLDCDAQVTGAPQPMQITWDLPVPRKFVGSLQPPKKMPPKKPATKATTKPAAKPKSLES
jgi:hypothetical protein